MRDYRAPRGNFFRDFAQLGFPHEGSRDLVENVSGRVPHILALGEKLMGGWSFLPVRTRGEGLGHPPRVKGAEGGSSPRYSHPREKHPGGKSATPTMGEGNSTPWWAR